MLNVTLYGGFLLHTSILTVAAPLMPPNLHAGCRAQFTYQQQSSPLRGQGVPSANVSDGELSNVQSKHAAHFAFWATDHSMIR